MADIDIVRIEKMITEFKDEIKEEFRHQMGIQNEHFQHKLDLVVEGHHMLAEKIDRVEERLGRRIDCVEQKLITVAALASATAEKLDAVAADIKAHRADTEVHKKVYNVKED